MQVTGPGAVPPAGSRQPCSLRERWEGLCSLPWALEQWPQPPWEVLGVLPGLGLLPAACPDLETFSDLIAELCPPWTSWQPGPALRVSVVTGSGGGGHKDRTVRQMRALWEGQEQGGAPRARVGVCGGQGPAPRPGAVGAVFPGGGLASPDLTTSAIITAGVLRSRLHCVGGSGPRFLVVTDRV